jgi:hypothetical protein
MKLSSRAFPIKDRWCLHSYYSLCPYAPDGSGRILISGADPESGVGEIFILSPDGEILQRFGRHAVQPSYWHTGFWQTWSPDAKSVYYQGGTADRPCVIRHDLESGKEESQPGEFDGAPPSGEPILSCAHSMLYAAGYGDNRYKPELSPVPFQARDRHGISRLSFDRPDGELVITTEQILQVHPQRERILAADREIRDRLGPGEGLTLMIYCLRWNRAGTRCLFFFGNHCVVKDRREPKINSIFTADRSLGDIRLALDLSFGLRGVHWSWQGDNENLIGYGPTPDDPTGMCLAEVRHDGTGYRWLSDHRSSGHPSTSPTDSDLIVTDEHIPGKGAVVFLSKKNGTEVGRVELPKYIGASEPPGRNPNRICHHPVFNRSGDRVLCNSLPGREAVMVEIEVAS